MSSTDIDLVETLKALLKTVPGALACSIRSSNSTTSIAAHQVRNAPSTCDPKLEQAMVKLLQSPPLNSLKEPLLSEVRANQNGPASGELPRHKEMQLLSPDSQRFALSIAEGRGVIVLTTTHLTRPAIAWAHLRNSAGTVDTPKLARLLLATSEREPS